jgi:hypothetical protein
MGRALEHEQESYPREAMIVFGGAAHDRDSRVADYRLLKAVDDNIIEAGKILHLGHCPSQTASFAVRFSP